MPRPPSPVERLARAYTATAQWLLSMGIAFVVINAILFAFPSLRATSAVETPLNIFGIDRLRPAYPGWTDADLVRLHEESRVVFRYEPVVQFRIEPIQGQYVNEAPVGYRLNAHQASWPPSPEATNVFVFGGSTTFGWLLPDRETIVSQLQDQVLARGCKRPVAVYNFGQPSYLSTQEALFYQSLLLDGHVPHVAVFIDGFNEFFFRGEMSYTGALRDMMDGRDVRQRLGPLTRLPLYQLARRLNARFFYHPPELPAADEAALFDRVIAQWRRSRRLIEEASQAHGVRPIFVWQPTPAYHYDVNYHFLYKQDPVPAGEPMPYAEIGRAYARVATQRQDLEASGNFLWLADIQSEARENLYVDRVHYNGKAGGAIADRIRTFLTDNDLIGCDR